MFCFLLGGLVSYGAIGKIVLWIREMPDKHRF